MITWLTMLIPVRYLMIAIVCVVLLILMRLLYSICVMMKWHMLLHSDYDVSVEVPSLFSIVMRCVINCAMKVKHSITWWYCYLCDSDNAEKIPYLNDTLIFCYWWHYKCKRRRSSLFQSVNLYDISTVNLRNWKSLYGCVTLFPDLQSLFDHWSLNTFWEMLYSDIRRNSCKVKREIILKMQ